MAEAQDDKDQSLGLADGASPASTGDPVTDTLVYLARALVSYPDDVRVETFDAERAPGYRLHVHPDDVGRVIGREGRVARSIRLIAKAAAARADMHAYIEIGG